MNISIGSWKSSIKKWVAHVSGRQNNDKVVNFPQYQKEKNFGRKILFILERAMTFSGPE